MRKKLLIRAGIGFLTGDVMVLLIPAIFSDAQGGAARLFSDGLLARVGSPAAALIASLLVYGIYGACCMSGMLLYDIESWSLALATAVHYLVIALGYALCAQVLCWMLPLGTLLLIEGFMTLGFVLIWLFLYLGYRKEVRELNAMRERMESEKDIENDDKGGKRV